MRKKYKKPKKYTGLKQMIERIAQDTLYAQGAYQPNVPSKASVQGIGSTQSGRLNITLEKSKGHKESFKGTSFVKKASSSQKKGKRKALKNPIRKITSKQLSALIFHNDN